MFEERTLMGEANREAKKVLKFVKDLEEDGPAELPTKSGRQWYVMLSGSFGYFPKHNTQTTKVYVQN